MQPTIVSSRFEPVSRSTLPKFNTSIDLPSNEPPEVVYVIDDDLVFREALMECLRSFGLDAVGFESAQEYLRYPGQDSVACLILNFPSPDICGLELLRLLKQQAGPPVIFISGSPDVPNTVRAMRAGAMEFFEKPVESPALVAAIRIAFAQHRKILQRGKELTKLKARFTQLTPRERQVLPLVVGGLLNKQAAVVLGISEVTLQIHRSQIMRKMAAESLADLVRMAVKLRIPHRGENQWALADTEEEQLRRANRRAPQLVAS